LFSRLKMQSQNEPIIKCENIHKYFVNGTTRVHVLQGVNLEIQRGEMRMLMGPSGSGKTTLISIIAGILTQTEGTCLIENVDLNHLPDQEKTHFRGENIGFVFQMFNLIPTLTTEENVSIPLCILGHPKLEALEKAKVLLQQVGLGDKIGVLPRQLSGGQQQRVAIARAMIHDPPIIVCDEPTSSLDHVTGRLVMELLKELSTKKNITVIVITHDPRIVSFADKINYIDDGKISDTPPSEKK
jgi:putative ABC transport system ATP-binding protein